MQYSQLKISSNATTPEQAMEHYLERTGGIGVSPGDILCWCEEEQSFAVIVGWVTRKQVLPPEWEAVAVWRGRWVPIPQQVVDDLDNYFLVFDLDINAWFRIG